MSKYLTKLKEGTDPYKKGNFTKFDFTQMNCANYYKEGLRHKFESTDSSDIELLIKVIKRFRLDVKIENITKNSFEFESSNMQIQIFIFRICRYVRNKTVKQILLDTLEISKTGIKFQNAFLLAHYKQYNVNYHVGINYRIDMDIVYDDCSTNLHKQQYLHVPLKNLKDLKAKLTGSSTVYNHLFQFKQRNIIEKETVLNFVKQGDYKAAEKYLFFIFK